MKLRERSVTVQGKDLAAALLFAGAELVSKEKSCVLYGDVDAWRWHFRPVTNRGASVKKLIAAHEQRKSEAGDKWKAERIEALNKITDEDLFLLAMEAIQWRHGVQQTEKEKRGDLCIAPTPNSRLVMGPGLSKAKEEILLRAAGI